MSHYLPLVSAFVTMLVATILVYSKNLSKAPQFDQAEEHSAPSAIPRTGGIALISGLLSGWALLFRELTWWIVLPLLAIFLLSLLDDMRGISIRTRLLVQSGAALAVAFESGLALQFWPLLPLLVLAIVWMSNLYNFMDGSDGLVGGMTFFGFTAYGVAALIGGQDTFAMMNFSVSAAALGFLYYNLYPAKVLMGEAGSIPLGFLAASMGLLGWQMSIWSLWFPILVFLPFILDTTITQITRQILGKRITEAHQGHYYQRLLAVGWSQRKVAHAGFLIMALTCMSALWVIHQPPLTVGGVFSSWLLFYAMLIVRLNTPKSRAE